MRIAFRNALAGLLRSLPHFRGKGRIGKVLQKVTTNSEEEGDCLVTFRMNDGTAMIIDLRSYTESGSFWTGQYDDRIIAGLMRCLREGSIVLDVGANIGFYSIPLGKRLATLHGKLYSVEPVPSNYERLVKNISLNGIERVVHALNIALGNAEGVVEMSMGDEAYTASTGNAVVIGGRVEGKVTASTRMTTLDIIAADLNIVACDLIKVDIEGYEFPFLNGGRSFLERCRPLIYLELNYHWMGQVGWSLSDLNKFAAQLGYSCFRQCDDRFIPATESGIGIENGLLLPVGSNMEQIARRQFSIG